MLLLKSLILYHVLISIVQESVAVELLTHQAYELDASDCNGSSSCHLQSQPCRQLICTSNTKAKPDAGDMQETFWTLPVRMRSKRWVLKFKQTQPKRPASRSQSPSRSAGSRPSSGFMGSQRAPKSGSSSGFRGSQRAPKSGSSSGFMGSQRAPKSGSSSGFRGSQRAPKSGSSSGFMGSQRAPKSGSSSGFMGSQRAPKSGSSSGFTGSQRAPKLKPKESISRSRVLPSQRPPKASNRLQRQMPRAPSPRRWNPTKPPPVPLDRLRNQRKQNPRPANQFHKRNTAKPRPTMRPQNFNQRTRRPSQQFRRNSARPQTFRQTTFRPIHRKTPKPIRPRPTIQPKTLKPKRYWTSRPSQRPWAPRSSRRPWTQKSTRRPWTAKTTRRPWTAKTTRRPWTAKTTRRPWTKKIKKHGSSEEEEEKSDQESAQQEPEKQKEEIPETQGGTTFDISFNPEFNINFPKVPDPPQPEDQVRHETSEMSQGGSRHPETVDETESRDTDIPSYSNENTGVGHPDLEHEGPGDISKRPEELPDTLPKITEGSDSQKADVWNQPEEENYIKRPETSESREESTDLRQENPKEDRDSKLPADLINCICQIESQCNATIGCKDNSCGPFQIKESYWIDAGSIGGDWRTCTTGSDSMDCSMKTVQSYIFKYARTCALLQNDEPGYEHYVRVHNGGLFGCLSSGTIDSWKKVDRCLNEDLP